MRNKIDQTKPNFLKTQTLLLKDLYEAGKTPPDSSHIFELCQGKIVYTDGFIHENLVHFRSSDLVTSTKIMNSINGVLFFKSIAILPAG